MIEYFEKILPENLRKKASQTDELPVLLINRRTQKVRLESSKQLLEDCNLQPIVFQAIEGSEIDPEFRKELNKNFSVLRDSEMGCLLSHMGCLYLASLRKNPAEYTMICEDDITGNVTSELFAKILNSIKKSNEKDTIDFVYLGKCGASCTQLVKVSDTIFNSSGHSCAHGYLIKNSFAKYILENFGRYNCAIDGIYINFIERGEGRAVVLHPSLFFQDVLGHNSDLRSDALENYTECSDLKKKENFKILGTITNSKTKFIIWGIILFILIVVLFLTGNKVLWIVAIVLFLLVSAFVYFLLKNKKDARKRRTSSKLELENTRTLFVPNTYLMNKNYKVFNPSCISYEDGYLCTVRIFNNEHSYNVLGIFDSLLKLKRWYYVIVRSKDKVYHTSLTGYEDLRPFIYKKQLYAMATNLDTNKEQRATMTLCKLEIKKNHVLLTPQKLRYKPLKKTSHKNWVPIVLNDELCFMVYFDPLLIVKWDGGKNCSLVYQGGRGSRIDCCRVLMFLSMIII